MEKLRNITTCSPANWIVNSIIDTVEARLDGDEDAEEVRREVNFAAMDIVEDLDAGDIIEIAEEARLIDIGEIELKVRKFIESQVYISNETV